MRSGQRGDASPVPVDRTDSRPEGRPDDVRKGRVIWLQRCAFCHDGLGTPTYNTLGPWLDSAVLSARGDGAVRQKILKGSATMSGFEYGLKAAQIDQLIAFLRTVTPEQRPTREQKAGKSKPPGEL
jgi:mono/diheme cytochrome c family protein